MNFSLKNAYLSDSIVLGGVVEGNGPLRDYLDYIKSPNKGSFEENEIEMLYQAIDLLMERLELADEDISIAIGGELSNQLTTTSYVLRKHFISLIGIYSACSTISLGLGLAGLLIENPEIKRILVFTSSHNQNAERQFRNPVEYGGGKEITQTYTSSIAACCVISKNPTRIRLRSFTLGKVIDIGFKNATDFGRAMAPAAIETLIDHFKTTNTKPEDYDLILTGDLSTFGYEIVRKALEEKYGKIKNYNDCGLMLYDVKKQKVLAGGSGPGTSAAVLLSYIKKNLEKKHFKRVLLCATGVLMNPIMINQKNSLPAIAHAIELEAV